MTEQSPAEAIFFAALEQGTVEKRAAYLDAACGGDADLRSRVERLLDAHPRVGDFMKSALRPEANATTDQPPPEAPSKFSLCDERWP